MFVNNYAHIHTIGSVHVHVSSITKYVYTCTVDVPTHTIGCVDHQARNVIP